MTFAIQIHAHGGPEVLQPADIDLPPPGPGEVRIRHTAIGLTYSDVNLRRGGIYTYALPLPAILGNEAAGVVDELGPDVTGLPIGTRVAYCQATSARPEAPGGYCEARNVATARLIRIPDGVSDRDAAAMMIPGLTASCLVNRMYRIKPGDTVLIHAVAGATGLLLCQWVRHLGGTVIGTVGSADKETVARAHGCSHVILYRTVDFVQEVRRIVPEGVAAVFDSVGRDTAVRSLDCIRRYGTLVNFGNASGPPPPIDLQQLGQKGSLSATRPRLGDYIATREDFVAATSELFELVRAGTIRIETGQSYRLADVASGHRDMEARRTVGSPVILP